MQVFNDGRIKAWTDGVPFEQSARDQVERLSNMPFIHKHVAVMPDVHAGIGATVGSVIATTEAIIPAAVGVDIGCGMVAVKTSLTASDLPDNLSSLRSAIEAAVPHGRTDNGGRNDRGAWGTPPDDVAHAWENSLETGFKSMCHFYPKLEKCNTVSHLGTLGTGNHFIEVCLDESQSVWVMLHSGSRGVGGRIGSHFISLAKEDMKRWFINLPDQDLAYLSVGSEHYDAYRTAVRWAQRFAYLNRSIMLSHTVEAISRTLGRHFSTSEEAINCHHNYVSEERHFGADVLVTRKGAVSAREGELGIIPGSMGAKSFIVRGKGNAQSFHSCSHGAGRVMSRTEAKKRFTVEDHEKATAGVECRKDAEVLDETPAAYKDVDSVMAAQADLVEVVHTLKQVLCVKG
jgi:tRNA-splicing ligase RtcB